MNLEKLFESCGDLFQYMEAQQYSAQYIKCVEWEIKWIKKKRNQYNWTSYEEVCKTRLTTGRKPQRSITNIYRLRGMFSLLQRFEENGEFPCRKKRAPLIKKASYYHLTPVFREIIDLYVKYAESIGLKESTIKKRIYKGSCFLLHLQNMGYHSLQGVKEKDVLDYFTDAEGNTALSSTYKRELASIFSADLGIHSKDAKLILLYLPAIRNRRKNIEYLTPREADQIRDALHDMDNSLSRRERAIGALLYYTGLRASDIAELRLSEIDWEKDQIALTQRKTGNPVTLPLLASVGNAIYDYIIEERPKTNDDHVFLWCRPPYHPIDSASIWPLSAKVYKAAGIRQENGQRRGSHLFRHHLATSMAEHGISQPIISDTLGHEEPSSLDHYLSADIVHLRQCAISIADYPVCEEAFDK